MQNRCVIGFAYTLAPAIPFEPVIVHRFQHEDRPLVHHGFDIFKVYLGKSLIVLLPRLIVQVIAMTAAEILAPRR